MSWQGLITLYGLMYTMCVSLGPALKRLITGRSINADSNENPPKTLRQENLIRMMDIIVSLQWNWLRRQRLTVTSSSLIHIKMQTIVYHSKVVAELTDDVIMKTWLTNMLVIMKSIHFQSRLAPLIGAKEWLQILELPYRIGNITDEISHEFPSRKPGVRWHWLY